MSGHISWDAYKVRKAPVFSTFHQDHAQGNLIAYTRGYILACEDMLTGMSFMSLDRHALDQVVAQVTRSMNEAKRGLEVLLDEQPGGH